MTAHGPFDFGVAVEIIAHRGYSAKAPENTLAALDLASRHGADGVEFDLHTAGDGEPVLMHDATLDRTTDGSGPVDTMTSRELERLDAGSWFSPAFAGEPVPTLASALDGPARDVGCIYAEVKATRRPEDLDRIARIVRDAGVFDRTVFISMDWEALDRIRLVEPGALIGYIVEAPERSSDAFTRAEGDPRALVDFDGRILLADPSIAARATASGIPLAVWTVNDAETASRLHAIGVHRFTTNEVETLQRWRETVAPSD